MNNFNVEKVTNELIDWIRAWFEKNGANSKAVIGISGGKDSTVVAGLMCKALGKERVIGVTMPNGTQSDIHDSYAVIEHLGIENYEVNIAEMVEAAHKQMAEKGIELTPQAIQNLPPRLRMSSLYMISQCYNGRVINTCNLSENWIGYSTRWGDECGDMSPLGKLTVTEVKQVGHYIGLPDYLVDKAPSDGLCGKTDEDNLGFTYAQLDAYIRTGVCEDAEIKERIDKRHVANKFKLEPMATFCPQE